MQGRRSGEIMGITEEEEEDDFEDVDDFSAVMKPGEYVDEVSASPEGVEKQLSGSGKGLGIH